MSEELFKYHIEETNARLERIEDKIDLLTESKAYVKVMVFGIPIVVSVATSLLIKFL